jgi:hypothetical protein
VINEPFVFGWQDDKLYLQAFDVLEDDTRDWKKAQKKLVSKSLGADIQKELKKRNEEMNWDRVATVAHSPRGIPVSISGSGDSFEELVASATRVQNTVPEGASWNGNTDLPLDEAAYRSMLSDRDAEIATTPDGTGGSTPAAGSTSANPPAKTGT